MITIIICSRNSVVNEHFENNIKNTIGSIHYEIISIDNSDNKYSICQAYNLGVKRAKYNILCFMHEDITFKSKDWGVIVCNLFKRNHQIGLCGVIGTDYVPNYPCGWWCSNRIVGSVSHLINNKSIDIFESENQISSDIEQVVTVDGLWFCIPKYLFDKQISFDEFIFKNFHCYDMDICLQVLSKGYEIVVCNNIDIIHKSLGNINDAFFSDYKNLQKKWSHILPIYRNLKPSIIEEQYLKNNDIIYDSFKRNELLKKYEHRRSFRIYNKIINLLGIKN